MPFGYDKQRIRKHLENGVRERRGTSDYGLGETLGRQCRPAGMEKPATRRNQ